MALRAYKHWRRRRLLRRAGFTVEVHPRTFSAGARSGVWTVCEEGLGPGSLVYSFGVGDNVAWDLALVARFGVELHAFDPTPESVAWMAARELPAGFHFHPIGLGARDGSLRFLPPRKVGRFNYSPVRAGSDPAAVPRECRAPVERLSTIMDRLGHRELAVLKIDIEGGEYDVFRDLFERGLPTRQLLVEFHHDCPGFTFEETRQAIEGLRERGFRLFHVSDRGLELGFVHAPGADPDRSGG